MADHLLIKSKAFVDTYNMRLKPYGVYATVTWQHHEEAVEAYQTNYAVHGGSLINMAAYYLINRRKEKKYRKASNRYQCLVLQIHPLQKGALPKDEGKQYSFLVRKSERSQQGDAPAATTVPEQRILNRLENRLKKWAKTAEKHSEKIWYRNNLWDALRYSLTIRYGYLDSFMGKAKYIWEILFLIAFSVLCVLLLVGAFLLRNGIVAN